MNRLLEPMASFFTARADGYDEHMLNEVGGCREGYVKMAQLVPKSSRTLLDLGCGTGLELDEIFRALPEIRVTGIDLTPAMLERIRQKHPDRQMNLICGDYFQADFGPDRYDCAISFQTMHHFTHEAKRELYRKIHGALQPVGIYIECDYMVETQEEEDFYFAENARIRSEQHIPEDAFYHYDTPCTVANQLSLLRQAGFEKARTVFREENTVIVVAEKHEIRSEPSGPDRLP